MSTTRQSRPYHVPQSLVKALPEVLGTVAIIAVSSLYAQAAEGTYTILARMIVTEVNVSGKTIDGYATHVNSAAKDDLAGVKQVYSVNGATFQKWVGGKKRVIKLNNVIVGDEIVVKGAGSRDSVPQITAVIVNDITFEAVGKLTGVTLDSGSVDAGTIKVQIAAKRFIKGGVKNTALDGKDVIFYVDATTDVTSLGGPARVLDEVPANNQLVKVTGERIDGWKFEVRKLVDGVK